MRSSKPLKILNPNTVHEKNGHNVSIYKNICMYSLNSSIGYSIL